LSGAAPIALVTGAGSGIGRAIALALGAEGMRVHLVARNGAALEAVAAEIGPGARVQPADLRAESEVEALAAALLREAGGLDVLVHSAGSIAQGPVRDAKLGDLDEQYRANLRGPYLLTQLLLDALIARRGQIVFINSSVGLASRAGASQFAATQHALKAMADSLRAEVNPHGVRVLSVHPGRTATPRQERLYRAASEAYRPELLMQPSDVAAMVLAALRLPRSAEVTEIQMRPLAKSY
jgi:NADP-dependent 3-hydroxy acid dehydrogenase YdfG